MGHQASIPVQTDLAVRTSLASFPALRSATPRLVKPGEQENPIMDPHNETPSPNASTLDERIELARKRIRLAEEKRQAVVQAKLDERTKKAELDELERQARITEQEAERFIAEADKLVACMNTDCQNVFLPAKPGDSICADCLAKRAQARTAPPSVARAPAVVNKVMPVATKPNREPEPCSVCKQPHYRQPGFIHPTSKCETCRKMPQHSFSPTIRARAGIKTAPPAVGDLVSNNPKKILKKKLEMLYRQGSVLPDNVQTAITCHDDKDEVVLTIEDHPEFGTFSHRFNLEKPK
ncbi:MAG: hypothetical protein U0487_01450 [Patescibacteria group bacterium]